MPGRTTPMSGTIQRTEVLASVITFDAYEKAEELEIIAEDIFEKKKNEYVEESKKQIEDYYKEKEKKMLVDHATFIDKTHHEGKLKVQNTRKDCIESLEDEIKEELKEQLKSEAKYKEVMKKLILQGVFMLLETEVNLVVKSDDRSIVEGLIDKIKDEYKDKTDLDLDLTIDDQNLPDKVMGGVQITALNKKIIINNTFENRISEILRANRPLVKDYLSAIYEKE